MFGLANFPGPPLDGLAPFMRQARLAERTPFALAPIVELGERGAAATATIRRLAVAVPNLVSQVDSSQAIELRNDAL